ncbi:hypothetical protein GGF38_000446 [Coemansia sp. RSA 25]|nr:hypothetical protein GGF38_000446 [Coemansia sp. RSA 25]
MSDNANEELKRQIKSLESVIGQQKRALSTSRYSSSHSNGRPPSHAYRYHPMRPPAPVQARPSRNMKLVVKNEEGTCTRTSAVAQTESNTAQYIACANKLVKVGSGNSASVRPPAVAGYRPRPARPRPTMPAGSRITINGETYIRKGRGNKLVRASPTGPATAATSQRGVVNIEGENYVRTKRGSLVRVDALRDISKQRATTRSAYNGDAPRRRRALCTKYVHGRCELSAKDCRYSHELTPETVPVCLHFQSGRCNKDEQTCSFIHVKVNPNAPICRDFVYKRFCAKGRKCLHRHVWECPDWVEKNNCARPQCKLPHPQKPRPKTTAVTTTPTTPVAVSKDEEELFIKQYVRRPVFGEDAGSDAGAHVLSDDDDNASSNAETHMAEDEYLSDEDMSGDEADELLKWYDDNYVDEMATSSKPL